MHAAVNYQCRLTALFGELLRSPFRIRHNDGRFLLSLRNTNIANDNGRYVRLLSDGRIVMLRLCCNGMSRDGDYNCDDDDDSVKLVHLNGQVIKLI